MMLHKITVAGQSITNSLPELPQSLISGDITNNKWLFHQRCHYCGTTLHGHSAPTSMINRPLLLQWNMAYKLRSCTGDHLLRSWFGKLTRNREDVKVLFRKTQNRSSGTCRRMKVTINELTNHEIGILCL